MRTKRLPSALGIAVILALCLPFMFGCASVGTGDPVVVKAEDVQVNSLSFYDTAMQWHFANSQKESKALYAAFEVFRVNFPPAWKTLSAAIPVYKAGKGGDLQGALAAIEQLLSNIKAVWTPAPAGGTSWIISPSPSAFSTSLRNSLHAPLRLAN